MIFSPVLLASVFAIVSGLAEKKNPLTPNMLLSPLTSEESALLYSVSCHFSCKTDLPLLLCSPPRPGCTFNKFSWRSWKNKKEVHWGTAAGFGYQIKLPLNPRRLRPILNPPQEYACLVPIPVQLNPSIEAGQKYPGPWPEMGRIHLLPPVQGLLLQSLFIYFKSSFIHFIPCPKMREQQNHELVPPMIPSRIIHQIMTVHHQYILDYST